MKILDANDDFQFAIALLDTQCQRGNWISERLLGRLGLSHLISKSTVTLDMRSASGHRVESRGTIRLQWKWHPNGTCIKHETFYILGDVTEIDVVIGRDYIVKHGLLRPDPAAFMPLIQHEKTTEGKRAPS